MLRRSYLDTLLYATISFSIQCLWGLFNPLSSWNTWAKEREREKLEWRNGEVSFYQEREREKGRNQGGAWSTIRHTRFSFSLERDVGKREAIEIRKGRNSLEVFVESLVESF